MKTHCFILLLSGFILACSNGFGQHSAKDSQVSNDTTVRFTYPPEPPSFPGGIDSLGSYVNSNRIYPPQAKANNVQGRVFVSFIIDRNGKPVNAKVVRGLGYGCDQEALRLINKMPNWIPAKENGQPRAYRYVLPVTFSL